MLGAVLSQRPGGKLTSLSVKCRSHNGKAVGDVAVCLPALPQLRSLDLIECGVMLLRGNDAPLAPLATPLPTLTALIHLGLRGNPLTNSGWQVLAPAAAGLPL